MKKAYKPRLLDIKERSSLNNSLIFLKLKNSANEFSILEVKNQRPLPEGKKDYEIKQKNI